MTGRMWTLFLVLVAVAVTVVAPGAQATPVTYNLTSDHCTNGCGPAGTIFGTVTLNQNGLNVDVTVHLNSPYAFAKTGAADFQAFKFNAVDVVVGDITVDAHTPALTPGSGAFNGDGTGNFGFGIACASCGNGLSDAFTNDIVFHVANATIADLTVPNNLGNVFVADVGNTSTGGPFAGNTGPVDATTPTTPVPEPGTLALVGSGLVSFGISVRRRWARRG